MIGKKRGDACIDAIEHYASGLTVVYDDVPSVGTTALAFFIAVGSRDESPDEWGVAHLLEHLAFKGARHLDQQAIAREIDRLGGDVNAFTTRDYTCFYARVLDSQALAAYQLLEALVMDPWLRDEDLDRERQVVLEEMAESQDIPDEVLELLLTESLYRDSAYRHDILGTESSLAGLDGTRVRTFFDRFYRSDNMVVAVSGGARRDVLGAVRKTHAKAGRGTQLPRQRPVPRVQPQKKHAYADWEQLHIGRAVPSPGRYHPDYAACLLTAGIVGGQNSSRLWQRLREEEGLVYSVSTQYLADTGFGDTATYLALSPSRVQGAVQVLREEVALLARRGPDRDELSRTRTALFTMLVMGQETSDARAMRLGRYGLDQRIPPRLDEIHDAMEAVVPADIQHQLEPWLDWSRIAVAWAGPESSKTLWEKEL